MVGEALISTDTLEGGVDTALPDDLNAPNSFGSASLEGSTLGIGGRYKILQCIGEGGFGTVYMAEQSVPVRRRVALKILKAGMDTRQLLARFEAERQALAMMDHPNIAKVFDGGETELGRPFFVMELVRGTPITDFCNREKLSPEKRLKLFILVCQAVQHAHQKGIIHRDLKPSNILITMPDGAEPVPKVIDFGVAKAMESNLTDKTLFTRFDQMIGTPAYMSPEQAGAEGTHDIDTRADIYALGVLLYELLSGTTPFESKKLQSAAFDEVRRILREDDVPRPSAQLSSLAMERRATIARERGTEAGSLDKHLRGDLDWIVMKAIEKDRRRRYDTANALALDVERHLANEPVSAGPPTVRYRFSKFLKRNKAGVGVAAVILFSLVGGLSLAAVGFAEAKMEARNARAAEEKAESKSAIATAINDFLVDDILGQAGSDESPEPDLTIKTALERAEERADARFGDQPIVLAEICLMLRHAYNRMSLDQRALAQALKAYRIFLSELGEDSPRTLRARRGVGKMMLDLGMLEESAQHLQATLEKQRELLGELHVDTMSTLHMAIFLGCDVKSLDEAVPHAREFAENAQLVFKDNPAMKFEARRTLAWILMRNTQSDQKEIEEILVGAEAEAAEILGDTPSVTRNLRKTLAGFYKQHRRFTEAEALWRLVIETEESMVGSNSPRLMSNYRELANVLAMQDKNKESQVALQRAMDLARINASETEISAVANVILDQSRRLRTQGRGEEARDLIREMRPRILEGCTGDVCSTVEKTLLNELAQTQAALKDYSTAEEVLREPVRDLTKRIGFQAAAAQPSVAYYLEVCLVLERDLAEILTDLTKLSAETVPESVLEEILAKTKAKGIDQATDREALEAGEETSALSVE
jgi:serine/threonine protein kinase